MIFEEQLLNYGVLGLWTIFNISLILYQQKKEDKKTEEISQVVRNNTIALTRVYEVIQKCNR